ncbi:hypothetical protein GOC19_10765 [Sinorhizobium meliloti]|nr:hypothetical protein [Sinorhizobium meliloti]UIJ95459.1 hypothetical protein LZK74_18650 [Sinorhizobium meliloti]WKL31899.1 hypothetical protein Q1M65_17765 [Sinorhizobium meliloti]WKL37646.1 hypothetical protein Q1M62_17360 [Sinorhizobium meliloti]
MSVPPSPPGSPTALTVFVEHLGKFILGVFGLVGVLVAVAGYAHSVGKDTGAAELSIYKTAEQLDLKKLSEAALATTADLKKASAIFKDLLATNEEYLTAKAKLDETMQTLRKYAEANKVFSEQNMSLRADLAKATDEINKLTTLGHRHVVKQGESVVVPFGRINLGLQSVSPLGVAELVVNGEPRETKPGDRFAALGDANTSCTFSTRSVDFLAVPSQVVVEAECSRK